MFPALLIFVFLDLCSFSKLISHFSCVSIFQHYTVRHLLQIIMHLTCFLSVIQILGEQLKLRQQVIATATVFFKRFYARNSLKCIDPLLLAPTCVFLASKVEEFGVISNSRLITTCQNVGELQSELINWILVYIVQENHPSCHLWTACFVFIVKKS